METVKPFDLKPTRISADCSAGRRSGQISLSLRSPSRLVPRAASTASAQQKPGVASLLWLHSTRNLDFCLLALCSCLLAILCHQVVVIPGSTAASSMASAATSRAPQLDFLLKAGLFTGKGQPEVEEESA